MTTVNLPFEESEIAVPLPEDWEIVDTVRPVPHAKLVDERAALLTALDHPIGTSPLRDKELARKRIVICVEDISRPTPTGRFFGALLDYLVSHGAAPANMLILFGLGVHRDTTPDEARHKLGTTRPAGHPVAQSFLHR
jgi:nickel-dependent lactate racemase